MRTGSATGPRQVLRLPAVRALLAAYGVSRLGDKLYNVAQVVVVLRLTHSAEWVSVVLVAHSLPYTLFKPLGGVLVDRFDRRRLLLVSDALRLALMVAFAGLVVAHGPMLLIVLVVLATTTAAAPYTSALTVSTAELLPEDRLASANAVYGALSYASVVAGPLVAAVVLTHTADAVPFLLNGVTFAVSGLLVAGTLVAGASRPGAAGAGAEPVLASLRTAVRVVHGDRTVRAALLLQMCSTFLVGLGQVLFALAGRDLLGIGEAGLGLLVAATGVGGVLGTGVAARAAGAERVLATMALGAVVAAVPVALLAALTSPWPALAVLTVAGAGAVTIDVVMLTVLQRAVPRHQLGRVDGLVSGLGYGALMLGNLAAPALVRLGGLPAALVAGGSAVTAVAAGVGLISGHRRLRPVAPDVLAALRRVPSLQGLDGPAYEALAAAAGAVEVLPAGTVLLTAGDIATEVLLLVDGSCDVFSGGDAGRRLVNQVAGPDLLGEIGVLQRRARTADVVATTPCVVRRVPAADFEAILVPGSEPRGPLDAVTSARLARWSG